MKVSLSSLPQLAIVSSAELRLAAAFIFFRRAYGRQAPRGTNGKVQRAPPGGVCNKAAQEGAVGGVVVEALRRVVKSTLQCAGSDEDLDKYMLL